MTCHPDIIKRIIADFADIRFKVGALISKSGQENALLLTVVPYMLLGSAAGLLSGLFGIGGGAVLVPILLILFTARGLPEDIMMQLAIGTSLTVISFTALSSVRAHSRLGNVNWRMAARLVPGIAGGALFGAAIAAQLTFTALRTIFAVFLLLLAVQMILRFKPRASVPVPGWPVTTVIGTGIGLLSALVGVAGGAMITPFLYRWGLLMRQAVGTSATCGLPLAIAGMLGYLVVGWSHPDLPAVATGFIYWPAVFWVTLAGVFIAPLGAKLAQRLPDGTLRVIYIGFLLLVSISMLLT